MRFRDHLIGVFIAWHLFAVFVQVSPPGRADLGPAAAAYADVRATLTSWTVPYQDLFGVQQSWRLFTSLGERTGRLEIQVREGGVWRPLFVERSRAADWNAARFSHYRWREAMFTMRAPKNRPHRRRFATWVSTPVFDALPSADAIRVEIVQLRVPPPETLRETGALIRRGEHGTIEIARGAP